MKKSPSARYMIGSITTKDIKLWEDTRVLQAEGETIESIFRRGVETLKLNSIDNITQNNEA